MADLDRSLEDLNRGDQCLDSKTLDQECHQIIDYLRSANHQVTELQVHLQQRTVSRLLLADKLIMATDPTRPWPADRRTHALPWKTDPQVRPLLRMVLLRQRRLIVHLALHLLNSGLLHRRFQVLNSMVTASLLILMDFLIIQFLSGLA